MAEKKLKQVELGAVYKNSYGDLRIPIAQHAETLDAAGLKFPRNQVYFVQKRKGGDWEYRPDIYNVTSTQFLLKFHDTGERLKKGDLRIAQIEASAFTRLYFTELERVTHSLLQTLN